MRKLVRPLLAGAGVTGALAAANHALGDAPLPTNALGGTRLPWSWRGNEIFATEAGSGPPLLLVHGVYAGASSYEFRKLFPLLARRHRVIAIDLLGCGLSAKPRTRYDATLFVEQIAAALVAFGTERAGVVGSSLGAAFALRAAGGDGGRIARIAAIAPSVGGAPARLPVRGGPALTAALRLPVLGEALFNVLGSRASIRWFLEHRVYAERSHVTPEVVDQYYAVAHQRGARYVPAAFVGGALACDIASDLPFLDIPLAVLWGERAPALAPRVQVDEFVRLARDARLLTFADSGLLPHEEEPAAVDAALAEFFAPRRAQGDG